MGAGCALMLTFSRLRNLVRDQLNESEIEKFIERKVREGWIGKDYEPERQHKVLPTEFETEDKFNTWVEETISNLIIRRKLEKGEKDKDILYLFRLLSMLYRVNNPSKFLKFPLRSDIQLVIELKICTCLIKIFESLSSEGPTKKKVSKTKDLNNISDYISQYIDARSAKLI